MVRMRVRFRVGVRVMRCEGHAAPCSCAHRHCCCCWAAALARCPSEPPSRRGRRVNPLALLAAPAPPQQWPAVADRVFEGKTADPLGLFCQHSLSCKAGALCALGFASRGHHKQWQSGRWQALWSESRRSSRCGASPLTPARGSPAACCAAAAACCAASAAPATAEPAHVRVWVWVWAIGPGLGL